MYRIHVVDDFSNDIFPFSPRYNVLMGITAGEEDGRWYANRNEHTDVQKLRWNIVRMWILLTRVTNNKTRYTGRLNERDLFCEILKFWFKTKGGGGGGKKRKTDFSIRSKEDEYSRRE